jgi:dephospho-CoA kinase
MMSGMRIVGLTGGIGAGKSTVASGLASRGAEVIDVDALGRAVLEPGGEAEAEVIARFGTGVIDATGRIDRAKLAAIVFADPSDRAALEDISHPAINRAIDHRLDELPDDAIVVLDMAVLLGSRLGHHLPSGRGYETVVVVEAPESVRIERLVQQRGMSEADARARLASQPTDAERRAVADHVVVNDGGIGALDDAVAALLAALRVDTNPGERVQLRGLE